MNKDIKVEIVERQRGVFLKIISRLLSRYEFNEIIKIIKKNNGRYNIELKQWGMNFENYYNCKEELKNLCTIDDLNIRTFLLKERLKK